MGESWFNAAPCLTWPDYLLFALCLGALFAIGAWSGQGESTASGFFLGGRRLPWWAVMLSFVATEISAMTVIGVPAVAYRENWQYLEFVAGSAAARVVIAFLFLPAFFRVRCTTVYEYLRGRFGPGTQYSACAFFLLTRILGSGVRLMAASVAVSVMLDWPVVPVIALFTTVSIVYISWGGIKAVVWTNVFQAAVFTLSGLLSLGFLILAVDGGAAGIFREALAHGRLSVLDFGPAWSGEGWLGRAISDPNLVWLAVINGFFTSMASFGTDQELVQRLLTVESRSQSQRSILLTIAGSTFVVVLYLCVGAGLFAFYGQHPELALPKELDKIYPHFAVQALPSLLRGLVLCAVVMASIDSPLASLATSFVTDLYRPLSRRPTGGGFELALSRVCVAAFGILLAAVAWFFCRFDRMLWLAFKIGGVTYGSLLGVFLLGLLTRRRADRANAAAMITMAALNLWLLVRMERGAFPLGWSWLILLGTLGTAALAWLLGPLLDRDPGPIPRAGP